MEAINHLHPEELAQVCFLCELFIKWSCLWAWQMGCLMIYTLLSQCVSIMILQDCDWGDCLLGGRHGHWMPCNAPWETSILPLPLPALLQPFYNFLLISLSGIECNSLSSRLSSCSRCYFLYTWTSSSLTVHSSLGRLKGSIEIISPWVLPPPLGII